MKTRGKQRKTKAPRPQQETPTTALIKMTGKNKPKRRPPVPNGDPKKPKKPPTAFFYFLEDYKKTFQEQNPSVKSMREIGKCCGEIWRTLPFNEKVAYYDIATAKRAEFEKAMAEYLEKKENGEESDDFDD